MKNYDYKLLSKYRTQLMGIAIIWVVFYHSTINVASISYIYKIKKVGYGGVDVFLMLSGIGLYFGFQKCKNTITFYKRRLLRIIPTYLPVVFIFCVYYWVLGKMSFYSIIMNITTLSFWFNSENRFDWYIPSIMMLYLITPIYFYFFNRYNKYIVTFLVVFFGIFLSIILIKMPFHYLLIFTVRIPIFFIGILIGYWSDNNKFITILSFIKLIFMLVLGITLLSISLSYYNDYLWSAGLWWYPFILITLPLSMLLAIFLKYIDETKVIGLTVLTFLGTHSLEIYLFHERVLRISQPLMKYLLFDKFKLIFNIFCIIVSLFLAYFWKRAIFYLLKNGAK